MGITTCIHADTLRTHDDVCILVQLIPRIVVHGEEIIDSYSLGQRSLSRQKWDIISTIVVSAILGAGLASAGTGIASLVLQDKNYKALSDAIDHNFQTVEFTLSLLEEYLSSLEEVVLQNRRRLDLLLLQQGGLCVALGEQCCFHTHHSSVIQNSLTELKTKIQNRQRNRVATQNWYENLSAGPHG